jgi:FeS assembly protein SufD
MNMQTNLYHSALSHYLHEYQRVEKNLMGATQQSMQIRRQAAIQQFAQIGFPTPKHPDWKYTSLLPFLQTPFTVSAQAATLSAECATLLEPTTCAYRLVFINGFFIQALSQLAALPTHALISHVANTLENNAEHLFSHWKTDTHNKNSFMHLNTAFMQDGAYIYLPPYTQLTSPIELISITTDTGCFTPVRHIIVAEQHSQATIIEKYITLEKATPNHYFTSSVTECFLATQSHLEHYKYIAENAKATHISQLCVAQQEKSQFSAYAITLSGGLIRSDTHVKLCQAQAQCQLKGLYTAQEKQQIDQQPLIEHLSPHTYSEECYKGIIDGNARAVFNGKLLVHAKAIKSKAQQLNKNLLLSACAEVYTKPQLEIFVDDIQCTHGASVGQLDEAALFYLRSRGLTATTARTVLIKAFIQDILQQMPLVTTHPALSHLIKNSYTLAYETV